MFSFPWAISSDWEDIHIYNVGTFGHSNLCDVQLTGGISLSLWCSISFPCYDVKILVICFHIAIAGGFAIISSIQLF